MGLQLNLSLYGQQVDFVTNEAHYALLRGGIGSGKSMAGAVRALLAGLGQVGAGHIPTPNLGVVTAPTYTMLRDATLRVFLDVGGDLVADYTKSPPINLKLVNGSEILFRSADQPDLLRGPTISYWWGDEAAFYRPDVWRIMIGRTRQFGQLGYSWLTTTPKGRNWLYQKFEQERRTSRAMYRLRTGENPFIDADYFQSLQEDYVGDFARQELDGDFVGFEGLIYPEFDYSLHTWSGAVDREFAYYVAGVDWGYSHPGVILVHGVDSDGRMYQVHEEYERHRQIDDWVTVAAQLQETYGIQTFYCDPSEPDYIDKFQSQGLPAQAANNTVTSGIQAVRARLVRQGDGLPRLMLRADCVQTLKEFEQYQWAEARESEDYREHPKKTADHTMDALRYAVMGVSESGYLITAENPFYQ